MPRDIDVLLSGDRASGAVASALDGHFIISVSPVLIPKAVKNEVQMQGIRDAHVRDGVYMGTVNHGGKAHCRAGHTTH